MEVFESSDPHPTNRNPGNKILNHTNLKMRIEKGFAKFFLFPEDSYLLIMSFGKESVGFFKDKEILLLEDDLSGKRITAAIEKTGASVTHCQNIEQENALNDLFSRPPSLT